MEQNRGDHELTPADILNNRGAEQKPENETEDTEKEPKVIDGDTGEEEEPA